MDLRPLVCFPSDCLMPRWISFSFLRNFIYPVKYLYVSYLNECEHDNTFSQLTLFCQNTSAIKVNIISVHVNNMHSIDLHETNVGHASATVHVQLV